MLIRQQETEGFFVAERENLRMKKNENTKLNRSWMAAFSVATTAFAAHAGGGFATGNQENTWFVSLGWPAIVGVAVAMLLLAMTIREGQIMMNSRGLKTYKELFECLYHPLDKGLTSNLVTLL